MSDPISLEQDMIGKTLAGYRIEQEIGRGRWGKVYRAVQDSMNRVAALRILSPELAALPGKIDHFLEEARAEAQILHPNIVAIYEARRMDGVTFCAMEFMDGPPLSEFLRTGDAVDEHRLLQIIVGVGRALDYLWQRNIPHRLPEETNLLTDSSGAVKLINVQPGTEPPAQTPQEDLVALGVMLARVANEIGPVSRPVGELVERAIGAEGRRHFQSLTEMVAAAAALAEHLFPAPAPAAPRPASQPKRPPLATWAGMIAGLGVLAIAGALWWRTTETAPVPRPDDFGAMVFVPEGEFLYQDGSAHVLAGYYIDKYEVTIGEYKKFLDSIAAGGPIKPHPFTPANRDFKPAHWDKILQAVEEGLPFNDSKLTWDSPVFGIDWYDAYAYAAWRNKRLPTEEEWERAARGTDRRRYPWGNKYDREKAFGPRAREDQKWAEVYANPNDKSPFGAVGMGGNVSEWTATTPTTGTAVIRGGSWRDPEAPLTHRWADARREHRSEVVGFRCAVDRELKP